MGLKILTFSSKMHVQHREKLMIKAGLQFHLDIDIRLCCYPIKNYAFEAFGEP